MYIYYYIYYFFFLVPSQFMELQIAFKEGCGKKKKKKKSCFLCCLPAFGCREDVGDTPRGVRGVIACALEGLEGVWDLGGAVWFLLLIMKQYQTCKKGDGR